MRDKNFVGNSKKIIDFLGKQWEFYCLGCAIRENKVDLPGGKIYESENIILRTRSRNSN